MRLSLCPGARVFSAIFLALLFASSAAAQSYTFTPLAGGDGPADYDGVGPAARFSYPIGMTGDAAGNLYVCDQFNYTIRKITPAGAVSTVAGMANQQGTDDGKGAAARFWLPRAIAVDRSGNLYVSDLYRIRKITAAGVVTTLAGGDVDGTTDGSGPAARFGVAQGIGVDSGGNVFVADTDHDTIRKVTPAGVVSTFAGSAGAYAEVDGTGSAARFAEPVSIAVDVDDSIFVADGNGVTIRKITQGAVVTTIAGAAFENLFVDGPAGVARFEHPQSIAFDSARNIYVGETGAPLHAAGFAVRKITPAGVVSTLNDATAKPALFANGAFAVAADSSGAVYVAETPVNAIRRLVPGGAITTFAGTDAQGFGSADGTGIAARFSSPRGVAVDASHVVYVADTSNNTIRRITANGAVTTLAGSPGLSGSADGAGTAARFTGPAGIAVDASGYVYVTEPSNYTIRRITPAGVVTTIAGAAGQSGTQDGVGTAARFSSPKKIAVDSAGTIYVLDDVSLRKITPPTWAVSTVSLPSTPAFMAVDSARNLYVRAGGGILKITPSGTTTTIPFTAPTFCSESSMAVDSASNIFIGCGVRPYVCRISAGGGTAVMIAGTSDTAIGSYRDGTGIDVRFGEVADIAVEPNGRLYVADAGFHAIRAGFPALFDFATIDFAVGAAGETRQLSTDPNTATTWKWDIVRRPATSTATFSSATIRNPVFTPDVVDVYRLQLTASNGSNTRVSWLDLKVGGVPVTVVVNSTPNPSFENDAVKFTVAVVSAGGSTRAPTGTVTFVDDAYGAIIGTAALSGGVATLTTSTLVADNHNVRADYAGDAVFARGSSELITHTVETAGTLPAPTNFTATAISATAIRLSWSPSTGADNYDIYRGSAGVPFEYVTSVPTTAYTDTVSANAACIYAVRATDAWGDYSRHSNPDLATTVIFTNDPLVARSTIIKAVHVNELRTAVAAVRTLANLPAVSFSDATLTSSLSMKTAHISELRSSLNTARQLLGVPVIAFSDSSLVARTTAIKAAHIQEIRNGVK